MANRVMGYVICGYNSVDNLMVSGFVRYNCWRHAIHPQMRLIAFQKPFELFPRVYVTLVAAVAIVFCQIFNNTSFNLVYFYSLV